MPTMRDPGTLQSAKSFCDDFLNAGGLSLVVNVLQREAIPADVDYETRQGCYAICLQLLRYFPCACIKPSMYIPACMKASIRMPFTTEV